MDLQESDDMYVASFTREFIFELWLSTSGSDVERRRKVKQHLIEMIPYADNVNTSNRKSYKVHLRTNCAAFYLIHLAYKLKTKVWRAKSQEDKNQIALSKRRIQNEFRQRLGLIVDKPRSGGSGTSNDGNTARKIFKNPSVSAEITGIQQNLIEKCGTILECISSGYKINVNKFDEYATRTAKELMTVYGWYHLPFSVHKVLVHGAIVIENALVPIGELSEEAAESTNKNIKIFRRNHTRKMSRDLTNKELIHRFLLNSDPYYVTSRKQLPRKKKSSPSFEVLSLLDVTE